MKTTILGGLLFLVPLAIIAIVLGKAFQISMLIAKPIDQVVPIHTVAGIAFINVIAVLLILALCFLAGLAAQRGWMSSRVQALDGLLIDAIPGYAVAKGMIGSVAKEEDVASVLKPVFVRFDDYEQIAFEIERDDSSAVIFLPGAPSTWSGSTVIVDVSRVTMLNVPTHQAVKLMRLLGRGSLALKPAES
ncbi:MAG: hypothetical protein AB3N23_22705 [Paracoccaceae bacterium]